MWESAATVLTSSNAIVVLAFALIVLLIFIALSHKGLISINTGKFRMGSESRERDIIRQQIEWVHIYLKGIEGQIEVDTTKYNGYFTKYIIEMVFDEILNWITFNHINLESEYISIKQDKIRSLVLSMDVRPQYKTDEFMRQIDEWVDIIIRKLVTIRKVYKV